MAPDLSSSTHWQHNLSNDAISSFEALDFVGTNPQLPISVADVIDRAIKTVKSDTGVALIRGLPVGGPPMRTKALLLALGRHVGTAIPQNQRGEILCEVRDTGPSAVGQRGYLSRVALPFHSDTADILALLCIRNAKWGGDNAIVSSLQIYENMRTDYPDLLSILQAGFSYAYPENGGAITAPIPVFSEVNGQVSCRYLRSFIEAAGTISPIQREALNTFDELATKSGMAIELKMQPGDLLLLNNYTVLHSRTDFEDHDDPAQTRLLCRLWLSIPKFRALHPLIAQQSSRFGPI